jgi:hypothetical protein
MSGGFSKLLGLGRSGANGDHPDAAVQRTLGVLDPARSNPGYWAEFRRSAMLAAGSELARRRRLATVTVSDVVFSWSRALLPTAAMAAAVALLMVIRAARPEEGQAALTLDEILWEGIDVSSIDPATTPEVEISFASSTY